MKPLDPDQNNDRNPRSNSESISDSDENVSSVETKNASLDEKAKSGTQEEFQGRVKKGGQALRNHIWYVRKCLDESFDLPELQAFCHDYFDYVYKRLGDHDGFDHIITRIIGYCRKHLAFESLWEKIKEKELIGYEYYLDWKQAFKENDYNEYEVIADYETPRTVQNTGDQPHPLTTEDSRAIAEWFFKTLTHQEQSLVLTVALFEGMNRRQMALIAQDINRLLFDQPSNAKEQ